MIETQHESDESATDNMGNRIQLAEAVSGADVSDFRRLATAEVGNG